MLPCRHQRKELAGFHLPPNTMYVGGGTRWENWIIHGHVSKRNPKKKQGISALKFRATSDSTVFTLYPRFPISHLQAALWYREWLVIGRPPAEIIPFWKNVRSKELAAALDAAIMETRARTLADISRLRGENLACWCHLCDTHSGGKPIGVLCPHCHPCHIDTLLDVANRWTPIGGG